MSSPLTWQLEEGVVSIVMDDGKVNVVSPSMVAALNEALDSAQANNAAVVLAGREGSFSAGFDLKVLGAGGEPAFKLLSEGFELAYRLISFPEPVVIACTGHALAMGVFLLLTGDYRVGAEGPYRIGANEVAIGMTMPYTAVELCRQRLLPRHFQQAMITSEIYSPAAAVEAGFLDRVVPAESVRQVAAETAGKFAQLSRKAYAATKERTRAASLAAMQRALARDREDFRMLSRQGGS
jgi:enoyl-CoA hydratase